MRGRVGPGADEPVRKPQQRACSVQVGFAGGAIQATAVGSIASALTRRWVAPSGPRPDADPAGVAATSWLFGASSPCHRTTRSAADEAKGALGWTLTQRSGPCSPDGLGHAHVLACCRLTTKRNGPLHEDLDGWFSSSSVPWTSSSRSSSCSSTSSSCSSSLCSCSHHEQW